MRSSRLFRRVIAGLCAAAMLCGGMIARSEEHTSELQSH